MRSTLRADARRMSHQARRDDRSQSDDRAPTKFRPRWVEGLLVLALGASIALLVYGFVHALLGTRADERRADEPQRRMAPVEWPTFELVDPEGRTCSRAEFAGHVWIADVLSLQCTDCPPLTGRIADVQALLRDRSIRFVSFSIDRTTTSGALAQRRAMFRRIDPARWTLLQSDDEDVPRMLVELGLAADLRLARARICSLRPHFYLIDAQGRLRGTYSGVDSRQLEWLAEDADALASAAAGDGPRGGKR